MQQHNHRLLGHCKRLERQKDVVMAQVAAMQDKWGEAEATRAHLQNEVDTLRKTLEARHLPSYTATAGSLDISSAVRQALRQHFSIGSFSAAKEDALR